MRRVGRADWSRRSARVTSEDRSSGRVGSCVGSLDKHQAVTNDAAIAMDVLEAKVGVVVKVELGVTVVDLVEDGGDVESDVGSGVGFNVSSGTVDDVSNGLSRVGKVGVVVDDGRVVDGVVTNGQHAFVPMNLLSS